MGLFDGIGSTGEGSSAAVAKHLQLPVVLVVDAGGQARSLAALVSGDGETINGVCSTYLCDINHAGVFLHIPISVMRFEDHLVFVHLPDLRTVRRWLKVSAIPLELVAHQSGFHHAGLLESYAKPTNGASLSKLVF